MSTLGPLINKYSRLELLQQTQGTLNGLYSKWSRATAIKIVTLTYNIKCHIIAMCYHTRPHKLYTITNCELLMIYGCKHSLVEVFLAPKNKPENITDEINKLWRCKVMEWKWSVAGHPV